ncbi:hypothetical protein [Bacillus sp. E214]|uniref:hypothetical protein n=1 Tax=Bacillus sp. E214 TaxID=2587156 RepID=UPI0011DF2312|nr:hypothetical protein [Bacillus sp. E214]
MNSFLERFMSLFFKETGRSVKPLMYAQLILFVGAVFGWFLVRYKFDDSWSYYAIIYLMLGTGFLLIGIEDFMIREKKRKDYLIWSIVALLFYWIAIDNYFFN